jgi:hypothetical protein
MALYISARARIKELEQSGTGTGQRKEKSLLRGSIQMKNGSQCPLRISVNLRNETVEFVELDEAAVQSAERKKINN